MGYVINLLNFPTIGKKSSFSFVPLPMKLGMNVMFASSLDVVNYQLSNVMDDRYVRIQSQLTMASAEMDNTTPQNIKCLQQEANEMIEENWEVINKLCDVKNVEQNKETMQKS